MHSSPHRNNSDFQLRYFIANSCHTADTAWCLMYEQKIDIQIKLESTKAKVIKRKVKRIEIDQNINSKDPIKQLNAQADLIEWQSGDGLLELAISGAEQEIKTITAIMDELQPQRKYAHLSVLEAGQASQREEWLLEFKHRVENYLITRGTIPEDQLTAMRNHPDFETQLIPHITETAEKIGNRTDSINLLTTNRMLISG
jgi:hypothetical protein